MQVVVKRVSPLAAQVRLNPPDSKVHSCQPPCSRVRLLPINGDVAATASVRLDKLFRLHEHTT